MKRLSFFRESLAHYQGASRARKLVILLLSVAAAMLVGSVLILSLIHI